MHLGSLPGLLLALAWGLSGGTSAHYGNTTGVSTGLEGIALYSIAAQAETPTATTVTTPTATLAVTATETVSATGTITSGVALTQTQIAPTAIPLPTAEPRSTQPSLQLNPFDWNFLTSSPNDPKLGPFAWVFLILMLALIAGGIYAYRVLRPRWKNTNTVWYRAVARFGQPALWIGVLGILFLFFRVVELSFFDIRLWLYLVGLAFLGLVGWFFYWYRNSYPKEMAKFQKTQKQKQYMPGRSKGPVRSTTGPSAPVVQPRSGKTRRKK